MKKQILQHILTKSSLLSILLSIALIIQANNLLAQNQIKTMEKNKQLIRKGFDQWTDGTANFFDLLAEDVIWTIPGNSPISKTYTSRNQFLDEAIAPLNDRLEQKIVPKLRAIYAEGDMVIALWDGRAIAKDGIGYNNTYSWHMKVKDDKIIEVIAFFDSIELADLWKRVPAAEIK